MKRCFLWIVLFLVLIIGVSAYHIVTISGGATSFFTREDISTLYNFTINNTAPTAEQNITSVSITLPNGFVFNTGSNGTNASFAVFTSSSSALTWTAGSSDPGFVLNATVIYVWFTANATTPGNFNFTITTVNVSGSTNITLIPVIVNDTTPPAVTFETPVANANLSTSALGINASATDNGVVQHVKVYLLNASKSLINISSGNGASHFVNVTGLSDGTYYINASANDSAGNINISLLRTVILDTIAPNFTFGTPTLTSSSVSVSLTVSDAFSGINRACTADRSDVNITGKGISQTLSETGLTCNSKYNYVVTCRDAAGNAYTDSITYTTSSCVAGQNTGGTAWKATYAASDSESLKGYTKELGLLEAVKVKVNNEDHYVGVVSFSTQSATINVTSTPQQATVLIGQTKQFEVSGDLFYDLNVTVRAIGASKVNVTILSVHEPLPVQTGGGSNLPIGSSNVLTNTSNLTKSQNITGAGKTLDFGSAPWFVLVAVISIVIVVVIFILIHTLRKSNREEANDW